MLARRGLALLLVTHFGTVGCEQPRSEATPAASASATTAPTASVGVASAPTAAPKSSATEATPEPGEAVDPAFTNQAYAKLLEELSEPEGDFFSDNFISNETSYLQPTKLLDSRPKGGAYLGVGPEQNFTYLAMTEPSLAFIVDIRRDNLVLHLLYKAAFDLATSRSHFLALLTGASYEAEGDPGAEGDIDAVLAHAGEASRTEASSQEARRAILERIASYGVELSATDERSLKRAHQAFHEGGLDIRFELKEKSTRKYPSFRELLSATSPSEKPRGFLASEEAFRRVQRMQRENRVIPVVGDFGGKQAIAAIADLIRQRGETVRHFYTSNVEQYLLVDGKWWKWQRNVEALPIDEDSAFIRGYLDQGKAHPDQMEGHRTATVLQPMKAFVERDDAYRSMWALCTDRVMPLPE